MSYLNVKSSNSNVNRSLLDLTGRTIAVATNEEAISLWEGIGTQAAFGAAFPLAGLAWSKTKGLFQDKATREAAAAQKKAELTALRGKNLGETWKNASVYTQLAEYKATLPEIKLLTADELKNLTPAQRQAYNRNLLRSSYYGNARTLLSETEKLSGKDKVLKFKEFEKEFARAKYLEHKAKYTGVLKPDTFMGKAGNAVKTATGVRALNGARLKLLANSKWARAGAKCFKGGTGMILFTLGGKALSGEYSRTKELCGTDALVKDVARDSVVALAGAAGWTVGAAVGAKSGAALGTVVAPGIGTVIGGIIGGVLGGVASYFAESAAKKGLDTIGWKSELSQYDEYQKSLVAGKMSQSPETVQNAIILNEAAIAQKEAQGTDTTELERDNQINRDAYYELTGQNPEIEQATTEQQSQTQQQQRLATQAGEQGQGEVQLTEAQRKAKAFIQAVTNPQMTFSPYTFGQSGLVA